jgi:hypothetical protein
MTEGLSMSVRPIVSAPTAVLLTDETGKFAVGLDASGNLNVNLASGTIAGIGNSAASATGAAVPASASYTGFSLAGTLVGVSAANPLPVSATSGTTATSNAVATFGAQTVGVASSSICALNAARLEVTITNTGTTTIFLGLAKTPTTANYSIVLSPCTVANDSTGGTFQTHYFTGAVNAISSAAGGSCVVTELP